MLAAISVLFVTIPNAHATCGLSFDSGSPINFGTLQRDQTSSEQNLVIRNTGQDIGTLAVRGTDWTESSISHIVVGGTKYAAGTTATPDPAGVSYQDKTALTNQDVQMGTVRGDSTNSTYWQLKAVLQNLPFFGNLLQTITFTISC